MVVIHIMTATTAGVLSEASRSTIHDNRGSESDTAVSTAYIRRDGLSGRKRKTLYHTRKSVAQIKTYVRIINAIMAPKITNLF